MNMKRLNLHHVRPRTPRACFASGLCLLAAFVASAGTLPAADDLPAPEWAGEDDALYLLHQFTTDSVTPDPEAVGNPHGLVMSEVFVEALGTGWRPPGDPFARDDSGGVWDLGREGWIEITVPLWPENPAGFPDGREVEFAVNVIAWEGSGTLSLPSMLIDEYEPVAFGLTESTIEHDSPFGEWKLMTWTGTLAGVTSNQLSFTFLADLSGSIIDTIEIHVIPEPGVFAVGAGLVALGAVVSSTRRGGRRKRDDLRI